MCTTTVERGKATVGGGALRRLRVSCINGSGVAREYLTYKLVLLRVVNYCVWCFVFHGITRHVVSCSDGALERGAEPFALPADGSVGVTPLIL